MYYKTLFVHKIPNALVLVAKSMKSKVNGELLEEKGVSSESRNAANNSLNVVVGKVIRISIPTAIKKLEKIEKNSCHSKSSS
ncbi:MAG: hypothetical protein ACTS8H_02405 [Arsenophonus sp. NC-PE1-MAG3]